MMSSLSDHLKWHPPYRDKVRAGRGPERWFASSGNAVFDLSRDKGAAGGSWYVDGPGGEGMKLDDVFEYIAKSMALPDSHIDIDMIALDFSRAVASCSLERSMGVTRAAKILDEALQDPASWAKERKILPIRKRFSPQFLQEFGSEDSAQSWETNCGRFALQRHSMGTWHVRLATGGVLVSLARKGIDPKYWSRKVVREEQEALLKTLAQISGQKSRKMLLAKLHELQDMGMI